MSKFCREGPGTSLQSSMTTQTKHRWCSCHGKKTTPTSSKLLSWTFMSLALTKFTNKTKRFQINNNYNNLVPPISHHCMVRSTSRSCTVLILHSRLCRTSKRMVRRRRRNLIPISSACGWWSRSSLRATRRWLSAMSIWRAWLQHSRACSTAKQGASTTSISGRSACQSTSTSSLRKPISGRHVAFLRSYSWSTLIPATSFFLGAEEMGWISWVRKSRELWLAVHLITSQSS